MSITVRIPTSLRKMTGGQEAVTASGTNVAQVLDDIDRQFPGFRARLCDADGRLKRFINFFVNNEDIRFLDDVNTVVKDGDEISVVPAIAGGA